MTRISYVSSYPPMRGRLSEYAYNLIEELRKCPSISHIDIVTDVAGNQKVEKINDKITIHRVYKADDLFSFLFILLKILSLKPDIVHFNVHMAVFGRSRLANFVGLSLPFACRIMGFKTVVTLHNIIEKIDIEKTGYMNTFINRNGAFLAAKLLALTSAVTFTMKSHADFFKKRYRCKNVKFIPHGTWKNSLKDHGHFWTSGTVLYMGHSGPYKDLNLLFDAFQKLEKKRPEVRLVVGGVSHPNYPGFLERSRSHHSLMRICFTGYIPDNQLPAILGNANVVILPYFTCTGTSGVAHLASSYGTPIVATDLPEFRELAKEGCGIIVAPHDSEALAQAMEEVIDNPNLALKLREQNLYFAAKRTWDIVASRFCTLYSELLNRSEN